MSTFYAPRSQADGRQAVVAHVPPDRLDLPLVRVHTDEQGRPVAPEELDLAMCPELAPRHGLAPAA